MTKSKIFYEGKINFLPTYKWSIKFLKKWKDKKDQIKDLKKAKHVIDMQIELLEKE